MGYFLFSIFILIYIPVSIILMFKKADPRKFKWKEENWAKYGIINKLLIIEDSKQINGKYIKAVKIIDSYTEMSDKLHGFLNYQEIIQTRVYKFKVVFDDGSSTIYTEKENSKIYIKLIGAIEINED